MGKFVKGEVVVVPFPFSDLSAAKRRPALVIASLQGNDVILCQITSKAISDSYAVTITNTDFMAGSLHQESHVRPNRLFTADSNIILYRAGVLDAKKMQQIIAKIIQIINP
ncbi:MAG TPA: type II toxin-antitoxin system PemK/MazF family toxin [Pyrinomonadaceae bacterium]|jgi:mRNA interferase MazF